MTRPALRLIEGGKGGMQPPGVRPVANTGEGIHDIPPYCHCGNEAHLGLAGKPICFDCLTTNLTAAGRTS